MVLVRTSLFIVFLLAVTGTHLFEPIIPAEELRARAASWARAAAGVTEPAAAARARGIISGRNITVGIAKCFVDPGGCVMWSAGKKNRCISAKMVEHWAIRSAHTCARRRVEECVEEFTSQCMKAEAQRGGAEPHYQKI